MYLYFIVTYLKAYKSFINGRYLSEGIRTTAGILFPAFLMSYYNLLEAGIVMSIGALCVSATDAPGPVHHRTNAMLLCNLIIGIVAVAVGFADGYSILLGVIILDEYYRKRKGEDPIVHFYETFLNIYDPATREKRGVYYTPEPVVKIMSIWINYRNA